MSESRTPPKFFNYPVPKEGPDVPYVQRKDENPVFRGLPLVIGAWLISKFQLIQKFLFYNAGFASLRKIKDLKDYNERWDPTVIPIDKSGSLLPKLDINSYPILSPNLPGRYHSVAEYHSLYMSGDLTPLAVAESLLPFVRRDLGSHHSTAWIDCHHEDILEAAKKSTERYKSGKPLSIFDGIPTGIKDETKVAGYPTTYGRKKNDSAFKTEEESAWPVQLFVNAGAIILGKLNMHEVGADTTNNNPHHGTPLNPHNDKYYPGGSSGGAAYAVSAGLIPIALGSDGGGSIRIPSSFCGLYGLKGTHSRLSNTNSTVTVVGPIAATMSDLAASYHLLSKPNPDDPISALFAAPTPTFSSSTRKIGYPKTWFQRADPIVLEQCTKALDYFTKKLNYELIDISIPYLPEGQLAHAFTIITEMATKTILTPVPDYHFLTDFNPAEKVSLAVGSQVPAFDYHLAQRMRSLLMQHLAWLYQQHPGLLIVTPTTPIPGWPISSPGDLIHGVSDVNQSFRNMEYVWLANFCGNPAVSVPVGYVDPVKGEGKIPIGLMAMGEWGAEDQLLEWGREAEGYLNDVYEGGRVRPKNWEDVIQLAEKKVQEGK